MQGWLADGIPVDAFKSHPASYRNHDEYQRDADRDAISVAVVLNDRDMAGEHDAVATSTSRAPGTSRSTSRSTSGSRAPS